MRNCVRLISLILLWSSGTASRAEFILFPQLNQIERGGLAPTSSLKQHDFRPGVDIFYSADFGRLRTLAEFEILRGKTPKAGTVERLQIGWLAGADTTVWLGRHHTPFGYWNTEYHHGSFLQSAVTRPGIIDFGGGAPLARHLTGLLIESTHADDDGSALHYSISMGASPGVSSGLKEFDIVDFNDGKHRLGAIVRAAYHPDALATNEAGAFLGYMVIPGNIAGIAKVEQAVLGGFGNWQHRRVRLLGELYWISNQLSRPAGGADGSFVNANLQVEYRLHDDWTAYARIEDTFGGGNDPYLSLFPTFIKQRSLVGTAYTFTQNQAIKLEIAEVHLQNDRFNQLNVQWSAALP